MQEPTPTGLLVAALVTRFLSKVEEFNTTVRGQQVPATPRPLTEKQGTRAVDAIGEECNELMDAVKDGDILETADALLDIVFFALGRLAEMGVPAQAVMDEINRANLGKERGSLSKRPNWEGYDAVKPEGWRGPDHSWLLSFSLEDVHKARMFDELSPIFQQITRLRAAKGQDYNNVPGGRDAYFPFGHQSYVHMLTTKVLRLQSLVNSMQSGRTPNFEGIRDTAVDLVNYGAFYAEAIDEGRVPALPVNADVLLEAA